MLRHFFALGAAIPLIFMLTGIIAASAASNRNSASQPITRSELLRHQHASASSAQSLCLVLMAWGEAGAIYFVVDAIRRKYRAERDVALALAIFGLITFGAGSLLYYAFWGHQPIAPKSAVFGTALCPQRLAETTDSPAPRLYTLKVLLGTRFMGSADYCDQCNSVVRTLWVWLLLPVAPLGSYRIVATDTNQFVGRKTSLNWAQVTPIYAILLAILAVVFTLRALYH